MLNARQFWKATYNVLRVVKNIYIFVQDRMLVKTYREIRQVLTVGIALVVWRNTCYPDFSKFISCKKKNRIKLLKAVILTENHKLKVHEICGKLNDT